MFTRLLDIIMSLVKLLLIILLVSMAIFLFVAVISRYLFGQSFFWIDAYSRYALIWISFLGSTIVLRNRKHVGVEIFTELLPTIIKKWTTKFGALLILLFSSIMFSQGLTLINITSKQNIPEMNIKMSNISIIVPVSAILMILISLEMIFSKDESSLCSGKEEQKND
jgi:C4-dicarboxylate transporter DctQ subunit